MLTDIEIAQKCKMKPITQVASSCKISEDDLELYGKYKAKVSLEAIYGQDPTSSANAGAAEHPTTDEHPAANAASEQAADQKATNKDAKLILVTAINPTPAGEGKTTTTVGLVDAMRKLGKNAIAALREPSLGPVFGIKGGAAGGGYAQVVPMEDINLHFTGDFHAIGAANNLLAAMLDNHIQQGNELGIDPKQIVFKRVVDMNDRQLRHIVDGLGGQKQGVPREDAFQITVASEVMAIFCLSSSIKDLKERLGRIVVAYSYDGKPITAHDLQADGAMTALLKDALKPNLVQTLEGSPAFVHGGPFANIAHGCNSVMATRAALKYGDYAITEAGFGADLGAEKFLDLKCRLAHLHCDAVVIVATIRALKYHGGAKLEDLKQEDLDALKNGLPNLLQHVKNITQVYKVPAVVALNAFETDTKAELDLVIDECKKLDVKVALSEVWEKGGDGGTELAKAVINIAEHHNDFSFSYPDDASLEEKLNCVAQKIYHADGVELTQNAKMQMKRLEELGFGNLPVCIAKTQYSFSDNPALLGAPKDFTITVRDLSVSAGAGFIVALTGEILTMPGLPKNPSACKIDVDDQGKITGLF